MSNNRSGSSTFWTTVYELFDTEDMTNASLFKGCINKIADRTVWLRALYVSVYSDFANATAGSKATVVGSVDLSGLVYDSVTGALNGLTLLLTADLGGTLTVTFGSGAGAPTGPADVVSQILTVTSAHQGASEDGAAHLNLTSNTTGGTSTITVTGGSAVSALGLTNGQNATGVASGADGISKVSGASVVGSAMTLPAGTLRAALQYIADHAGDAAVAQVGAYSGTSFTIAAGALSTFLHLLADKAAKLDVNNSFAGSNSFGGTTTTAGLHATGNAIVDGTLATGFGITAATGNITATTGNVVATGNVTCGGNVAAVGTVTSQTDIIGSNCNILTTGAGGINSATGIGAATTVTAGSNITAGGSVIADVNVNAQINLAVGTLTPSFGGGQGVLALAPAGVVASGSPTGCVLFVDGAGNLQCQTSGGHTRLIAAV